MKIWRHIGFVFCLVGLLCSTFAVDVFARGVNNRDALDSIRLRINALENSPASKEKAHNLRNYAYTAGKLGMIEEAQEYAQQAYEMYLQLDEPAWASLCLYERCIAYNSIGDTLHMHALLNELEQLAKRDTSAITQYNYYSILFAWEVLQENAERATEAGRKSIRYMEQIPDLRPYNIMPEWNYYNQALVYDLLYDPSERDSIVYYLDRAELSASRLAHRIDYQEVMVSVNDLRAWLYYYDKDYAHAETQMFQVLALIDTIAQDSPGSIITERGEAYAFLVELYTSQGRYAEALHYQQLLTENNNERYSLERQRILDDVQTKYEVAQKELTIERQKRINQVMMNSFAISVLAIISILTILIAVWNRKRRIEEELYAKALEAENMHNELLQAREYGNTEPLEALREGLLLQLGELPPKANYKADAMRKIRELNLVIFKNTIVDAADLSVMDKRYLMCFAAGLTAEQIAEIFNISPASVYTVRYRIKRKNSTLKGLF